MQAEFRRNAEGEPRADVYARVTDKIVADLERACVRGSSHGTLATPTDRS